MIPASPRFSFLILALWLSLMVNAVGWGGIPEPPMLVFGEIQLENGQPAPPGNLVFTVSDAQGTVLAAKATMASDQGSTTYLAQLPVESQIIDKIKNALTLGQQYSISVAYNGVAIQSSVLQPLVVADRGKTLGPLLLSVGGEVGNPPTLVSIQPTAPVVQVGQAVHLTITAQDLDSDPLQFSANPLDNLSIVSSAQTGTTAVLIVAFLATEQTIGSNTIQFTVSDGKSQDSKSVTIEVSPAGSIQPKRLYEFDQSTLANNGWLEIPGGFTNAVPAMYGPLDFQFDPSMIATSSDQKGLAIYAQSGQITFFYAQQPVQSAYPVLMRLTARANTPKVQVGLVALKGDVASGLIDGSIATHILTSSTRLLTQERQILMLYQPDTGDLFTPAFQIAADADAPLTTVLIDRMEIFELTPPTRHPAALFDALADAGPLSPANGSSILSPDRLYEMDKNSLLDCGWKEIPGGFISAPAGYVIPSPLNAEIASSQDKKGLVFLVRSGEVNFIFASQAFDTQSRPVLLRATV
ncbi:MAG: hypothetical protein RBU29_17905, partial [bacterium]|nr:hypothetical protein [bacterium]